MLYNKLAGRNYFVALMILLALITFAIIGVFIITAFIPHTLGHEPVELSIETMARFEPWHFSDNELEVSFPGGGYIVGYEAEGKARSYMLAGEGRFIIGEKTYDSSESAGIFFSAGDFYFESIRGNIIFTPVEDGQVENDLRQLAEKQSGLPIIWSEAVPLAFHLDETLNYYYLMDVEGSPILPPQDRLDMNNLIGSILVYALLFIIVIILVTIFSLDHRSSRYWFHLGNTPPGILALTLVPLTAVILTAVKIVIATSGYPDLYTSVGYAIVIIILVILAGLGKLDYLDLGLRRDRLQHGYFLAVLAAVTVVSAARGMPVGICTQGSEPLTNFLLLFLIVSLPRELYWRGFIQALLSRRIGPTWGLVTMIIIASASRFAFIYFTTPWMLAYNYTYLEVAVLVPGLAALLGYLYLRTENILACTLLHSLILWLPGIILY